LIAPGKAGSVPDHPDGCLGQRLGREAAIVSGSAFIAMEKTNLAPLGVALHGIAIAAGFLALLATISTPPAFVGVTAAMAAASILVTAKGDKLRHLSKGQA
jgi:hypothetical protein